MTAASFLTSAQAAELIGVSERKFHELRSEPWMPLPIELGPRALRWVRAELEEALVKNAPRTRALPEPEQLRDSRTKP